MNRSWIFDCNDSNHIIIKLQQNLAIIMRENPQTKNGYRVCFNYLKSPTQRQSVDNQHMSHQISPTFIQLRGIKERTSFRKSTGSNSSNHAYHFSKEQTLRKQGWGVAATTTRKQIGKKIEPYLCLQAQLLTLKQDSVQKIDNSEETTLLKEQIRYMRNKLNEVETAQKALRLQFELYKVTNEMKNKPITQNSQEMPHSQKLKNNQRRLLQEELHQQQTKRTQLQLIIAQQLTNKQQLMDNNNQLNQLLKTKSQQAQNLRENLQNLNCSLNCAQLETLTLKANKQNQFLLNNFSIQLEKMTLESQKLNDLFQSQKKAKQFLKNQLKAKLVQNNVLSARVDQLRIEIDCRHKDIAFLNHQSYSLDLSLNNAFQEISYLKSRLVENEESRRHQLITAKQKIEKLELQIIKKQGEISQKVIAISDMESHFNVVLLKLKDQILILEVFKQKSEAMQQQKLRIQKQKIEEDERNLQTIRQIQDELIFSKAQNYHLNVQKDKLEENLRALVSEIEGIITQRDNTLQKLENRHNQQKNVLAQQIEYLRGQKNSFQLTLKAQLAIKDEQIMKLTKKCQQLTDEYVKNLKNLNIQSCQSEFLASTQAQPQSIYKGGKTLTQSQLKMHLLHIKKQSSINEEQNTKLRQMLYTAKQELQVAKQWYENEINSLKQRHQKELRESNQEYTAQFNFYIEEIQRLMLQMDKLKSTNKYNSRQVIEQQPQEQNEVDNQKVQKDLIRYGQDPSDFYVSPPSNILNKESNQEAENGNYMLQDIIDLDQKIHSYISNLSKRQNRTAQ